VVVHDLDAVRSIGLPDKQRDDALRALGHAVPHTVKLAHEFLRRIEIPIVKPAPYH